MERREQIRRLWVECFDDTEAFVRLFFGEVYKEENALVIEEKGRVVSALQMLPYRMTYYGKELPVAYIYGACTAPEARGRGLMRQLLWHAFEVMKQRGVALTVLIPAEPWLFDYYREMGYTEAFDYSTVHYSRPDLPLRVEGISVAPLQAEAQLPSLYRFFDRKLHERNGCMLHTYEDLLVILKDVRQEGGELLTATDAQGDPAGMLIAYRSEAGMLTVRELLYDREEVGQLLLQEVTMRNGTRQLTYTAPPRLPDSLPLGMARLIDPQQLLPLWRAAHPDTPHTPSDLERMDVRSLTALLLGYPRREAYMNLMLN